MLFVSKCCDDWKIPLHNSCRQCAKSLGTLACAFPCQTHSYHSLLYTQGLNTRYPSTSQSSGSVWGWCQKRRPIRFWTQVTWSTGQVDNYFNLLVVETLQYFEWALPLSVVEWARALAPVQVVHPSQVQISSLTISFFMFLFLVSSVLGR